MRSNAIYIIKAFAILGVVFHHIGNRRFDSATLDSIHILPRMFSWAVLTFIAISGWLHAVSEEKQSRDLLSFTRQRFIRLLIPYVIFVFVYALIWHIIQVTKVPNVGMRLDGSFLSKIYHTISPYEYEPVAEQLYFLPLLFLISIVAHISIKWNRFIGPAILSASSLLLGLIIAPGSGNTGLNTGMFLFGLYCYTSSFLLYTHRQHRHRFIYAAIGTFLIIIFLGLPGLPKAIPVITMISIPVIDKINIPSLNWIGEASGTIYAYHTPFIVQPLILIVACLPSSFHFSGAVFSALLATLICTIIHHTLKATPARVALM